MKTFQKRLTVVGLGIAVLATAGTTGAVASRLIDSADIRDDSVRSVDVRNGTLRLQDLRTDVQHLIGQPDASGPGGPQGPAGPPGPQGQPGQATGSIVATYPLVGPVASILANSGNYVFAGPPADVTTSESHPRVTASAAVSLGLNAGVPQFFDMGVCYQPPGGTVTNFVLGNFSTNRITVDRANYAASATVQLAPGTFRVGVCVRNNGAANINNNNYVNGWVQVTS